MNAYAKLFLILFGMSALPHMALAQLATITSFTAAPSPIRSADTVAFQWTMQYGGGHIFRLPCISGVKYKKEDGSSVACDTNVSFSQSGSDAVVLTITNTSGSTQTITARLTPKNADGTTNSSASSDATFSVTTEPTPILTFTTSATTTTLGQGITLSWTTKNIDGVNLMIECKDTVIVSSPSYAGNFPCARTIFTSDLAVNSSISINFTNSSSDAIPLKFTLLPAITAGSYDATHAANITITVGSDTLPDPTITSLTASKGVLEAGEAVTFTWTALNSKGSNIRIACSPGVTASSTSNPSATLPCDANAFTDALAVSGSVTLAFQNKSGYDRNVTIRVIPSKTARTYDALRGTDIILSIRREGFVSTPTPPPPPGTPTPPPTGGIKKPVFFQTLRRGSRGPEVNLLQEFLKRVPAMYPEGLVTAYFGPATERAVQRFQVKYGIVSSGTPYLTGYGSVGPRTRLKLNELY